MDGAEVGMKRLWIILAFLALAGCVPVESNPDLYVAAQSSRATSDAAAQEALFQERYLTATAEAPIIHITQTAAALVVQATQQSIDQTSTAVLWTPTPSSTPTIIPSATPNLTATLNTAQLWGQQTAIANNIQRDNLELDRQRSANDFWAALPGIVFVLVAGALIVGLISVVRTQRYKPVPVDARGNPAPMIDIVDGTVTDIDRSPNYRADTREDLLKQWLRQKLKLLPVLPDVTAARQDVTTERDQMIDLGTRGLPAPANQQTNINKKTAADGMNRLLTDGNMAARFKVLEDGSGLEVVDGEIMKVLDADWKEAQGGPSL
jgi:hypothetical protein